MEQYAGLQNKAIISLVGGQGSGKSTIGRAFANKYSLQHVETSDVVKLFYTTLSRTDLARTGRRTKKEPYWLGKEVATVLNRHIGEKGAAVLTGVREIEVHNYLESIARLFVFEVSAAAEVRYQRVLEMGKVKNAIEFIEHELREKELGLHRVTEKAPYMVPTSPSSDPLKLVTAIDKFLTEEAGVIY